MFNKVVDELQDKYRTVGVIEYVFEDIIDDTVEDIVEGITEVVVARK